MEDWMEEFPGAVTVADKDFRVVYVNARAAEVYGKEGGRGIVGRDLLDCHKPRSNEIMRRILETGSPNAYTVERKGVRKFIYQAPWRKDGAVAGLVELSMEIPFELPHFNRDRPE